MSAVGGTALNRLSSAALGLGLTRHEGFCAAVDAGIRVERTTRRLAGRATGPPPQSWHVDGDGPPVVLINGWTLSGAVWPRELIDRLATSTSVVRPDNRGTGARRRTPLPFTMADLADDVAAVIDEAALPRPVVVGLSLGGMIAAELAIRHPGHVGGLVLVASRPPNPRQVAGRRDLLTRAFGGPVGPEPIEDQLRER